MKPKAIVFDWDNTLVNTLPITLKALNLTLRHFFMPEWSESKLKENAHFSVKSAFPEWFGNQSKEATEIYKEAYLENNSTLELLPDSLELLKTLRNSKIRMGIISNKISENLKLEIERMGLSEFFECVIGSGDAGKDKPNPDPMWLALSEMKLGCQDVVYYGDTEVDMKFAKNAGCHGIGYGSEIEGAEINFFDHKDFVKFLKNNQY